MSVKPISILIFVVLIVSCGSSKQTISTTPTEASVQVEQPQDNNVPIKIEVPRETILEVQSTEPIETVITEPELITNTETKVFDHNTWNELLQKHVSIKGHVNYKTFLKDKSQLKAYINNLTQNLPQDHWDTNETLAYWINAYNALTIDLILRNYPLKSIKDLKDPWDQRLWKFGSKWYNLNTIEHQILRKMNEPRIHFAIVCASVSCPKLQNFAFNSSKLNEQLDRATKEFLSDETKNQLSENHIKLSKIFKWFGNDFKSNTSTLIDFLNQYTDFTILNTAKKSYIDYNWDLND